MKRIEFLTELSRRLYKLPKEELDNVISYYDEIFLDAGVENEDETSESFGNIDDIARQILVDNNIAPDGEPEYYVRQTDSIKADTNNQQNYFSENQNDKKSSGLGIKLLIIILTFPIWLPILAAVFGIAFGFLIAVIAIVFAFAVSGIACVASGLVMLFIAPPIGILTLGIGLIICGLFGIIGTPALKAVFRGVKNIFNGISSWIHNIIEKRRTA